MDDHQLTLLQGRKYLYVLIRTRMALFGEHFEFDILAVNGEQLVVEVKTTLRPEDVNHFLGDWPGLQFTHLNTKGRQFYGAVAYLKATRVSAGTR